MDFDMGNSEERDIQKKLMRPAVDMTKGQGRWTETSERGSMKSEE
jgi:hypothetical protein